MENKSIKFTKNYFKLKIAIAFLLTFALVNYLEATINNPLQIHSGTLDVSDDKDTQIQNYYTHASTIIKKIQCVDSQKRIELIADVDKIADMIYDKYGEASSIAIFLKGYARFMAGKTKEAKPYYQKLLNSLRMYIEYDKNPESKYLNFTKTPTCIYFGYYYLNIERNNKKAIYYYNKCVDNNGKLLPNIEKQIEKINNAQKENTSKVQKDVVNNNKDIRYVPSEDMMIISWGTGRNYDEAYNNAKNNAVNQVISIFGKGTKEDCQIKGSKQFFKFKQSDGSIKLAIKTIIKAPMLNGGNSSNGATTSFVGSKYNAKEKMMEKNKTMEIEVLNEVLRQVKIMLPRMYTRRLTVTEPKNMTKETLDERLNTASEMYDIDHGNVFPVGVAYDRDNGRPAKPLGHSPQWKAIYNSVNTWMNTANTSSLVKFYIKYLLTDSDENNVNIMVLKALKGMSMEKEEIKEYDKANKFKTRFTYYIDSRDNRYTFYLRSSDKEYLEWVKRYVNILYDYYLNFDIVDNLGGKSHISNEYNAKVHRMSHVGSFTEPSLSSRKDIFVVPLKGYDSSKYDKVYNHIYYDDETYYAYFLKGTGLFSPYAVLCDYLLGYYPYFYNQLQTDNSSDDPYVEGTANERDEYGSFANRNKRIDFTVFTNPEIVIQFLMPNAKLGDYTKFTIKDRVQ